MKRFRAGMFGGGRQLAEGCRIAQIDIEPEEFASGAEIEIGVTADAAVALEALCAAMDGRELASADTVRKPEARAPSILHSDASSAFYCARAGLRLCRSRPQRTAPRWRLNPTPTSHPSTTTACSLMCGTQSTTMQS